MNASDYHAHPALSHSQIEDFIASPAIYFHRHVRHDMPFEPDTESSSLGTALHSLILEGQETYDVRTAVWRGGPTEKGVHTMRRGTKFHSEWEAAAIEAGKTIISEPDHNAVQEMAAALHEHDEARSLLFGEGGVNEHTLIWDEGGLEARCRVDRVLPEMDIIVDLKGTADTTPDARARRSAGYGYHRKAEWYRRGYFATYGRPLKKFVFIYVPFNPPFLEHIVCSFYASFAEQVAVLEIDRAVADIKRRRESGDWRPDWSRKFQPQTVPHFMVDDDIRSQLETRYQ